METGDRKPETGIRETGSGTLAERIRRAARGRRRSGYLLILAALAGAGVLVLVVSPTRVPTRPVLPKPESPRPEFAVLRETDMPARGIDRLTVAALVRPGLSDDALRQVLDWLLHEELDRHNRLKRRNVRVVWAYALEDSTRHTSRWRAMAIWVDPGLPERLRPEAARIGGDAVRAGAVEYDFTNPVSGPGAGEKEVQR